MLRHPHGFEDSPRCTRAVRTASAHASPASARRLAREAEILAAASESDRSAPRGRVSGIKQAHARLIESLGALTRNTAGVLLFEIEELTERVADATAPPEHVLLAPLAAPRPWRLRSGGVRFENPE